MDHPIVESLGGVTLVGGGPLNTEYLHRVIPIAPSIVAADSGYNTLTENGFLPKAVIGDLDSLSARQIKELGPRAHKIPEQITTDFDKALRHITAPFIIGLGFLGGRLDHSLASLSTLLQHPTKRCILLDNTDLVFLAPKSLRLCLGIGTRLSLYPLGEVNGEAQGLRWPIEGLDFTPDGRLGTSNETLAPEVALKFNAPKMLLILPISQLQPALDGLLAAELFRGE